MNKNIIKIRNFLILTLAFFIMVITSNFFLNHDKRIINTYDYSTIKELKATVVGIENTSSNGKTEKLKLEDGTIVNIGIGGGKEDTIGSDITVYTDGTHYELTKESIALSNSYSMFFHLLALIPIFLFIAVSTWLYGWKGALFSIIIIMFYFLKDE